METQQPAAAIAAANQNLSSKQSCISFSESFRSSDKQGGGALVLGERQDSVTRETCLPSSHRLLIIHFPHLSLFYFLNVPNEARSPTQGVILKPLLYAKAIKIQSLKHKVKTSLTMSHLQGSW
jgi:hypothetical protein